MIEIIDLRFDSEKKELKRILERRMEEDIEFRALVEEIISDVKKRGDEAVFEYTKKFDRVLITAEDLKVKDYEFDRAYRSVDLAFLKAIRRAIKNIERFHENQKTNSWFYTDEKGSILGQICSAIESVGIYVPGGSAAYPSSVLMNAIPAKIAGVKNIIMVTPPPRDGRLNPYVLVAASELGIKEIYKVGGAQAIAALAFGTDSIPRVDKIVGPGNIYVATAKRLVYGYVDIDMIAGPSEILIISDETAEASFIVADLLSQAEHDVMASSILITTSWDVAEKVQKLLEKKTMQIEREEIILKSITNNGKIIVVNNLEEAIDLANQIAPEHIEVMVRNPIEILYKIKNAGSIFLGNYSPEPLGDYMAGPNHVLPTGGTARFSSPLSVDSFIKKSSFIYYTREALEGLKEDIIRLAEAEGLYAHAESIKARFNYDELD